MPFEEKSAWIMAVLAVGTYAAYAAVILGRAQEAPLAEVAYVSAMLWAVGVSIAASVVLHVLVASLSPADARKKDQRDKEIARFGEYIGQSFLVVGGVSALAMSMAELHYFWISNTVYLAFVLSAILGSAARIVAYRRGFQPW
ncbi:hypothetical protein [Streptomyces sp. ALI-76-A]|jgi:cobalamin synthase|uniref:hypothetical protein n=1 Tax=Streptomyces sp. ALI-76-A TaxID=3025736 RepID=UPI00256F0C27|nr:hypothetical protein [Streptomyces sp. ALI-76-A]MDL5205767.1 hypothetical protein [Streptomyces sp. ALI-76-A]